MASWLISVAKAEKSRGLYPSHLLGGWDYEKPVIFRRALGLGKYVAEIVFLTFLAVKSPETILYVKFCHQNFASGSVDAKAWIM